MTLFEIVLVLLIVAALSVYAAINIFGAATTFKLNSAAAKIIADITFTQHSARTHNSWYGIRFQADPTNQYSVYETDGITDTNLADPVNPSQQMVVDVATQFKGVVISAVNIAGGDKVEFNPRGVPYDDFFGAPLAASGTVTISVDGSQKVIQIMKNTGRVGVQ